MGPLDFFKGWPPPLRAILIIFTLVVWHVLLFVLDDEVKAFKALPWVAGGIIAVFVLWHC